MNWPIPAPPPDRIAGLPRSILALTLALLVLISTSCIAIKRANPYLNTMGGRDRLVRLCEQQLRGQMPEGAVKRIERGRFDNDDAYGPAIYVFRADVSGAPPGGATFLCIGEEDGRVGITLY
jgi:hypothetical protein